MEHLSRYHRVTVRLWTRSHAELARPTGQGCLPEAAVHALLAVLRRCTESGTLFARYEADASADFALIGSMLEGRPVDELFWRVRESAYYLRWSELADGDDGGV